MTKKTTKRKARNYAATETTLINLRAMKKRIAAIERRLDTVEVHTSRFTQE